MNNLNVLAYLCSAAILAACSQPETVMEVSAEPIYNKLGDVVGCTDGRTFIPGTAQAINPCAPPEEECDPNVTSASPDCPPPRNGKHEDLETDDRRNPATGAA